MKARALALSLAAAVAAGGGVPGAASAGTYPVLYGNGSGCGMFAASATAGYAASVCGGPAMTISAPALPAGRVAGGTEENISTTAPPGVTITGATANFQQSGPLGTSGWGSGDFYSGGGNPWNPSATSTFPDPPFASSYWGFQIGCSSHVSSCAFATTTNPPSAQPAVLAVNAIQFQASEAQSPSLIAAGADNLYYESGHYVWNPAGDPWSIATSGSDPSGTCNITAIVDGQAITLENQSRNPYAWQQCVNGTWPGSVDTRQYVGTSGPLALTLQDTNAAGNTSTATQTLHVDNDPVSVSLSTPNDANPSVWVNHPVSVQSSASAGPSGIAGTSCTVDGGHSFNYADPGFTVDGDGAHTASCTASNNAVDPQGAHNTGAASETIRIDEAPPALAFEPVNPSDPTALVVNASDGESGVASGSITEQGPHATTPTALPTTFDGAHLLSRFNDGAKNGNYTFVASSCDAVGNCASTSEVLHFPIRLGSESLVSFATIQTPAKVVRRRVRVGYRLKSVRRRVRVDYRFRTVVRRRHGRLVKRRIKVGGHLRRVRRRIKVGGHMRLIKVVIHVNRRCGHRRVRVRRHRWREVTVCRKLRPRVVARQRVGFGRQAKLHGLLTTAQGAPIAGVPVRIFTRPDDRGGVFRLAAVTATDAYGVWTAKLPGGPSRTIRAFYPGSATVEPATGTAQLTVPAKIRLFIAPHILPWAHAIHIHGHLVGRYVPHDGVALRLLVRYPHSPQRTPLLALRTNRHGAFAFTWSYHAGRGVATYPFSMATTATETDYPYAASSSRPVSVTFGEPTPRRRPHHHRHPRRRRHHRHHHR